MSIGPPIGHCTLVAERPFVQLNPAAMTSRDIEYNVTWDGGSGQLRAAQSAHGWDVEAIDGIDEIDPAVWGRVQAEFWRLSAPLPTAMTPAEHISWLSGAVPAASDWELAPTAGSSNIALFEAPRGRRAAVVVLNGEEPVSEQELASTVERAAELDVQLVLLRNDAGFIGDLPESIGVEVLLVGRCGWEVGTMAASAGVLDEDRLLGVLTSM